MRWIVAAPIALLLSLGAVLVAADRGAPPGTTGPATRLWSQVSDTGVRLAAAVERRVVAEPLVPVPADRAIEADAFADRLGVVVHLVYADSGYRQWPQVRDALDYLGVKTMRELAPLPTNAMVETVHEAAREGYRFCFLVMGQVPLKASIDALAAFALAHPGSIAAIEGPNEVNNFGFDYAGKSGNAAAQAFQADLYKAVHAEPALRGVPVYNLTSWPDLAGQADYANFHSYTHAAAQPFETLRAEMQRQLSVMPGRPIVLTEAGYHNTIGHGLWEGVDPQTAGPLILNMLLDTARLNIRAVYVYQLLDGYPDPKGDDMERHFGLFDTGYRPKPAATGIRNLILTLRAGSQGQRAALTDAGAFGGLTADIATVSFARKDGARVIAISRRVPLWDPNADRALAIAPITLSYRPPRGANTVAIVDPLKSPYAIASADGGRAISFALGARPLLLVAR